MWKGGRRKEKNGGGGTGWGEGGDQEPLAAKWDATCRPLTFTCDSQSIAPALPGPPPISGVLQKYPRGTCGVVCLRTASPWQQHHYQNSSFFHSFALFLTLFLPPSLRFAPRLSFPSAHAEHFSSPVLPFPSPLFFFLSPNPFIPSRTYLSPTTSTRASPAPPPFPTPPCPVAFSFFLTHFHPSFPPPPPLFPAPTASSICFAVTL